MHLQVLKTAAEAYLKTARGQIETLASEEYWRKRILLAETASGSFHCVLMMDGAENHK